MNKKTGLLALTGVLTLAACGNSPVPTPTCNADQVLENNVCVTKPATTGSLTVPQNSNGYTLTIVDANGNAVSPSQYSSLQPGAYKATYSKEGYTSESQNFTIAAGKSATLAYPTLKVAVTPEAQYDVAIKLEGVSSAEVTVADQNGFEVVGAKTIKNGESVKLPKGTYTVRGKAQNDMAAAPVTVIVADRNTGVTLSYGKVVKPVDPSEVTPSIAAAAGSDNKVLALAQDANGRKETVNYVRGKVTINPKLEANNAERIEVFTNATTDNLNAANRIYDSRDNTGTLTLDTATLRQGEKQYVIVRYWKGTESSTKSFIIIPDNLGPQVPDVLPVSKLSAQLTRELGNWVNGDIKLAFQNLATLRDNPAGTSELASGVERVEWYADPKANDGVADINGAKLLGTSYNSPYEITVDTKKELGDGMYDVFAVAYDQLGNRSIVNAQNLFTLNVDNTGPEIKGGGEIKVEDAGTGSVFDEFNRGGTAGTFQRRANSCKIDAFENAGSIDLYDAEGEWVSGLARVTKLNFSNSIKDTGVGIDAKAGAQAITLDGQPLLGRLYTLPKDATTPERLTKLDALKEVNETGLDCSDVFLDVNGLDAGDNTVRFNTQNAVTDLLGNPATGGELKDFNIKVDNQAPSNLRFSRKPTSINADQQASLAAVADDSISGLTGSYRIFGRDTGGAAFGGRAVELASADKTNYRFFRPTNSQNKLDLIAVVRDNAGNVSSVTDSVNVQGASGQRVYLDQSNLFVRKQEPNGQFQNFEIAQNQQTVSAAVNKFDILTTGKGVTPINSDDILQANFYEEVQLTNPLNRVGRGTADKGVDDLNIDYTQQRAPLFLLASAESLPYAAVAPLNSGLFAYHAATIDKAGYVSSVDRKVEVK